MFKLGFHHLPAQRGHSGVRDGGKTRSSFRTRLNQYYADYEHQRGKSMCRDAGLLELGCQGLKFGYFMIPVWTPTDIITEEDEEEIFTIMECLWDCVSHSGRVQATTARMYANSVDLCILGYHISPYGSGTPRAKHRPQSFECNCCFEKHFHHERLAEAA
jgi:hypothetical protein